MMEVAAQHKIGETTVTHYLDGSISIEVHRPGVYTREQVQRLVRMLSSKASEPHLSLVKER